MRCLVLVLAICELFGAECEEFEYLRLRKAIPRKMYGSAFESLCTRYTGYDIIHFHVYFLWLRGRMNSAPMIHCNTLNYGSHSI